MGDNIIKYGSRTFFDIRNDLTNYIKQTYPTIISDFSDSSVGSMLLDSIAGVGNNLSVNTDRIFSETQLEYAQQRSSLLNIAKNMGFNIPARRPSATLVEFTVTVPVKGDRPDADYLPVLSSGSQVIGNGKIFETQEIIDWNSGYSSLGTPNRTIIPNFNGSQIISYNISKTEILLNGSTSVYKRVITTNNIIPFFSITLPDEDVIEIDSIILLEGTNFSSNPVNSEFYENSNRYYEVDYLAQQKVFIENTNNVSNTDGIKMGIWFDVTKKFIKEFTVNGFCKITFGSGDSDVNAFKNGLIKYGVTNKNFLDNFLNNTALGEKLKPNYTLFVKYRTGGGSISNVPANVITRLGSYKLNVNGRDYQINQSVERSLKVNNITPAIGGNDGLSNEQIRQLIKYNFSSQHRDVTLTDYLLEIYKMPGKFGSPFRASVMKLNNKILISMLGIGSDGTLDNTSNSSLQSNISEYLTGFRMINDYIEIKNGRIYNLGFDISVHVNNVTNNQIANDIVITVKNSLDINKHEMNDDLYLGNLQKEILAVNGVVNVIEIKVYNKNIFPYSTNVIAQEFKDAKTGEIKIINNTIYSTEDSMFEIKYPDKDIRVFLSK